MLTGFTGMSHSFNPNNISGCTLWLRADKGITISTGVSQWNDQSGNGFNFTQATGSAQPTYNSSGGPNGLPYLSFAGGSSQCLTLNSFVASTAMTIFIVYKYSSLSNSSQRAFVIGNNNANGISLCVDNNSLAERDVIPNNVGSCYGASNSATTNWEQWTVTATSGAITLRANGLSQVITNPTSSMTTATTSTSVGAYSNGTDPFTGGIAEIIVYNVVLSAANISLVETYLNARYGFFPAFQPPNITGNTLWLRADQGITIATGVSQWNDLSGNGSNVTQATTTAQPTYNSSGGLKNTPYVTFSRAGPQWLYSSVPAFTTACSIFIVYQYSAVNSNTQIAFAIGNDSLNGMAFGTDGDSNTERDVLSQNINYAADANNSATTSWEQWTSTCTSGAFTLRVNGSARTISNSTTVMNTATTYTILGANIHTGGTYTFGGNIAEVIVYNSILSADQINIVENYLNGRYGI